ncbi:hypothetical protein [Hymenobacter norwichensis]|uniref:hypothetical protein n=1 Tax=Hymenobacter norwichensis TaxID=223903 RepID=UPI0003B3B0A4|nr:hypothetical protein [Hymenobacter norwichensis]
MTLALLTRLSSGLLLGLSILSSCGNEEAEKQTVASLEVTKSSVTELNTPELSTPSNDSTNAEYLDWSTAKLNGRLPMLSTTKVVFQELGQPDSLITPDMNEVCMPYFDQQFKFAYIKSTEVEVCGDTAVVDIINFQQQPQLTLQTGNIRLNSKTTLSDLAKDFPNAVRGQYELNVYKLGKVVTVNLASGPIQSDYSWLLMFQHGKLVRIEHYTLC